MSKHSPMAVRAALSIINSAVNPAMRHDAANVTAGRLATIIDEETGVADLLASLENLLNNWEKKPAAQKIIEWGQAEAAVANARGVI